MGQHGPLRTTTSERRACFVEQGTSWVGRAKWCVNFNQSGVLTRLVSRVSEMSLICPPPGCLNGAEANCKMHRDLLAYLQFHSDTSEGPDRFGDKQAHPVYTSSITQVHCLKPRLGSLI